MDTLSGELSSTERTALKEIHRVLRADGRVIILEQAALYSLRVRLDCGAGCDSRAPDQHAA